MKTFMYVTNLFATLVCINTIAMEQQAVTYHRAVQSDAEKILHVINTHGIHDRTKIVILPEKFREGAINEDILKKRIYCATQKDIVGYKKLFIINDANELNDIARNEIRCHGENSFLVDTRTIDPIITTINPCVKKSVLSFNNSNSIVIYFGGDYTIPSHRERKINSYLTGYAFEKIKKDTIKAIKKNNSIRKIVLLYGLTKANAGEEGGIDRSPSIIKAFKTFIANMALKCNYSTTTPLYHTRYEAFMPTFDPKGTECKPLPDDQAIAGYGNTLIFPLLPPSNL